MESSQSACSGFQRRSKAAARRVARSSRLLGWRRRGQIEFGRASRTAPMNSTDLADRSCLPQCRLSFGEPVTAGGRSGYRLSRAGRQAGAAASLLGLSPDWSTKEPHLVAQSRNLTL
jgi:hypothetical protein